MNIGQTLHGFTVTRVRQIAELDATLIEMVHTKSGARLAWLKRDDPNKLFSIAFKTVPWDDTGVFHILEHSVLCGSKKYPLKEPFVDLLKGSLHTFLNAITFEDKTMYPISSRNEADFLHLTEVYLDAVFAPALYTNPNIFRQEGWHYEIRKEEDMPTYKGVVFNEMKGAYSSVDRVANMGLEQMLFPDTCYCCESGGNPKHIPDLTYEQFKATHAKFYHPSNALIFLDGDLPIEKTLKLMDEDYLSHYDVCNPGIKITYQVPTPGAFRQVEYEVAPGEDTAEKCQLAIGKLITRWDEKEKNIALNVLFDAVAGSNEAPFNKAILSSKLAQDFSLELNDGIAQCAVMAYARNTEADRKDAILSVIRDTAKKLVSEGIDRKELEASINRMEFHNREHEEPQGLLNAIISMDSWLYGGDPAMYLEQAETFTALREKLNTSYFEDLLAEALLDEAHNQVLLVTPSETLGEVTRKEEEARLATAKASWSGETVARLVAENESLDKWQQTPDTPAQKATLPHLTLDEIEKEPEALPTDTHQVGDITVMTRKSAASGITYINAFFSAADLALEDLAAVDMATGLLGVLPTRSHSAQELQREIKSRLGSLSAELMLPAPRNQADVVLPMIHIHASALDEKVADAIELMIEVMTETDFTDDERIRENLLQTEDSMRQGIIMAGHRMSMRRSAAHSSAACAATEAARGFTAYQWVKKMNKAYDENKADFARVCKLLQQQLTVSSRMTVSFTGVCDDALVTRLADSLPTGEPVCREARYPYEGQAKEAILIPAGISYAAMSGNVLPYGGSYTGASIALSNILSFDYLWNEVRVKGGAYGTGFQCGAGGNIGFYSYRDPNGVKTLDVYKKSTDYLADLCKGNPDMEKFIIGSISSTEPLMSAEGKADAADTLYLTGVTYEDRRKTRAQLLSASKETLADMIPVLEKAYEGSSACVIGNQAALEGLDRDEWTILDL